MATWYQSLAKGLSLLTIVSTVVHATHVSWATPGPDDAVCGTFVIPSGPCAPDDEIFLEARFLPPTTPGPSPVERYLVAVGGRGPGADIWMFDYSTPQDDPAPHDCSKCQIEASGEYNCCHRDYHYGSCASCHNSNGDAWCDGDFFGPNSSTPETDINGGPCICSQLAHGPNGHSSGLIRVYLTPNKLVPAPYADCGLEVFVAISPIYSEYPNLSPAACVQNLTQVAGPTNETCEGSPGTGDSEDLACFGAVDTYLANDTNCQGPVDSSPAYCVPEGCFSDGQNGSTQFYCDEATDQLLAVQYDGEGCEASSYLTSTLYVNEQCTYGVGFYAIPHQNVSCLAAGTLPVWPPSTTNTGEGTSTESPAAGCTPGSDPAEGLWIRHGGAVHFDNPCNEIGVDETTGCVDVRAPCLSWNGVDVGDALGALAARVESLEQEVAALKAGP